MLNKKRIFDAIGIIILFTGFSLAFLPHVAHVAVGLGEESSHLVHVVSGISLVILALGILIYNKKK